MNDDLKGMKVAILATDGVERIELEQPRGALYGAGAASDLLSIRDAMITTGSSGASGTGPERAAGPRRSGRRCAVAQRECLEAAG